MTLLSLPNVLMAMTLLVTPRAMAFSTLANVAPISTLKTGLHMTSDPLGKSSSLETLNWDYAGQFGGSSMRIEGQTLRTCPTGTNDRILFHLKSNARRPMKADLQLYQGPDYIPWKLHVYSEDGGLLPYYGIIETPLGPHNLSVRNLGSGQEFPMDGVVYADGNDGSLAKLPKQIKDKTENLQGKAIRSWTFEPGTKRIQILLNTDGRHLKAKVEILEGPNNVKSFVEVYSSNGYKRPLYLVTDAFRSGTKVRITNQCSVEYPLNAAVESFD